jgi:hypothetical protein
MNALIKWIFQGGHDGSELSKKRGEQRAFPFDVVYDEMLGDGKVVGYAASADGDLTIEYIEEGKTRCRDSAPLGTSMCWHSWFESGSWAFQSIPT